MKTLKTLLMTLCLVGAVCAEAETCHVDVLFAIDAKAVDYLQDEKGGMTPEQYVADQALMMNEVLTNSGLSAKFVFRSVGVYKLGFEATRVDPTKYLTRDVLEQATLGQGQWAKLHNERDNRGADIVSVIVDTGDKYGHVGDSNSLTDLNDVAGFSENAYSVVGVRSTFDWHALLHEVGHNFGAGHAGGADQSAPYSHGWYFVEAPATTNAYTVMAYLKYDAKGKPIPEAPIFSSPKLTWKGAVAGDANTADNVRVIEQTYEGVSKWRKAPDDPPTGAVGPYMTTSWDQGSPFNDFAAVCGSEKAPCGCAATAAVQMFKYYGWPIRLDTAMTGEAHKYVDDVSYPFTLRFDGHNAFQWATMKDQASQNDVVGNYEAARATLWCDTIGAMDFRPGDSSAQFSTMAESATLWFEKGQSYSYSYHGEEALWAALVAALDRKELVQVMLTGHQVVADGYAIEEGVKSVHINWGTNDAQTKWYTWDALKGIGIIEFWTGFRPKKTAQMRLLPKKMAAGVVTVSWDFPNVYTNDVTGFSYTRYVTTTSKGDYTGDGGTITPDCADNYYQPGVFGITGTSTFDYTMTSYYVWGLKVELQARFDAGEWVTIDTPTLSGAESEEVYKKSVDLSAWSGKEAEFRFKASRTGKMTASSARISFAAPKMKNVYRPLGDSYTIPGGAGVRSFPLLNTSNAGRVISVKITPLMTGGVSSEPISVKLAKSDETVPAQPVIVSLDSLSSEITDGFQRTCGIGKSVFFVKVNETTTAVTASPSHLALVDDDAVQTKKLDDTTWAVTIDAKQGTVPPESQMILTIVASDAIGNKSYKDLQLTFRSGEGGAEQEDMLAEKIAAGNFLYVPTGTEVTLPLEDERFVAGKGTVTFDGGMPSFGPERGFNYQDSWKGLVKFINFTPTQEEINRINYEFVNVNSKVEYESKPEPQPGKDLYWNGNAWTNAAGTVVTPVAESVLHTKEGDVVPYTSAVVGTFDGAGTVKLSNANATTSSALSKWVTNGNFSATFDGTLWLAKGRFEASAPVSQNVTIKVTDGAQLSANGSEWSNHFVLSGDGWDGEAHYDFSHCALRVEATLGTAATLEFVKDGDVVPAIGAYNAERNIKATLVGEDGFRVMGGGTMKFTEPTTQTANLKGTIEIIRGTARFGEGQYSNHPTFAFGDKIVVDKGATFFLHCNTQSIVTPSAEDKVAFATAIDLNGGTFRMEDGSYVFTKDVSVFADSTMVFKWRKGRVFQSLKGSAVLTVQGTCNPNASEADGYAVFAGGDFSGTIRSTANATKAVNLYVVPLGEALRAATVDLVAQGKLRLTEDATIGVLSGTKPIAVTNAGDVHTLTIAKGAALVADTANAALVSDANLALDGAAIALKDYEATACYLATAPAISAKGATLDPVGWKLTLERDGKQDVLKAVPLAPFLFFVK